jgi:hypothetical protein
MMHALRMLAVALALHGCSSDQGGGSGSDGGPSSDGGAPNDLANADLSQSPPADLAPYVEYGYVFARSDNAAGAKLSELVANLYTQPYSGLSCTTTVSGACKLEVCVAPPPAPPFASAGTLTLTGGTHTLTVAPMANGSYSQLVDATQTLWSGGETLTLTASGATVPAFSTSVTAPAPIVVAAPAAPAGGAKLTVSRSSDLTFTWTGGGGATVGGGISAVYGSTAESVTCTVPASAGTFTLPASLIAQLPASPTGVGLFASSWTEAEVVSGSFTFRFQADTDSLDPAGAGYGVQITLN